MVEDWAPRSFADVFVFSYGHAKHVTLTFGCLEMPDMAGMKQIENSMTLNNLFTLVFKRIDNVRQFVQ
jgi:hypothetical protein